MVKDRQSIETISYEKMPNISPIYRLSGISADPSSVEVCTVDAPSWIVLQHSNRWNELPFVSVLSRRLSGDRVRTFTGPLQHFPLVLFVVQSCISPNYGKSSMPWSSNASPHPHKTTTTLFDCVLDVFIVVLTLCQMLQHPGLSESSTLDSLCVFFGNC